jgi:hypothetical protein
MKPILAALAIFAALATSSPGLACDPKVDKTCCDPKVDKRCPGYHDANIHYHHRETYSYHRRMSPAPLPESAPSPPEAQEPSLSVELAHGKGHAKASANDLVPVREYLRNEEIPPAEAGAYGIIVFQSLPTPATRAKALMVCHSFVAFFPRNESISDKIAMSDRMITIWPIDDPTLPQVKADNCEYAVDHYDMAASVTAIRDAKKQSATFDGEGPYLVGWSPSNTRGVPGKLVLVVDMSNSHTQETIDHQFLFWKNDIVQNPSLWRSGFSLEGVRVAIHDFADEYGQDMLDAIKLIGFSKP